MRKVLRLVFVLVFHLTVSPNLIAYQAEATKVKKSLLNAEGAAGKRCSIPELTDQPDVVSQHTHMCMHARIFFGEFALKGFTRTRKSPSDLHHQAIAVRKVLQSQPVLTRILGRHRHLHNTAVSHRLRLRPEEDQTKTRHGFSEVLW